MPAFAPAPNAFIDTMNAGREYKVQSDDHGRLLFLGNASDGRVSTFVLEFVPNYDWQGDLAVVARIYGKPASDNGVGFVSIPVRRVAINNQASDRALVGNVTFQGQFIVEVPCNGLSLAVLCNVQAGSGTLYSWPLNGPAT
jgi:hypothetical protein